MTSSELERTSANMAGVGCCHLGDDADGDNVASSRWSSFLLNAGGMSVVVVPYTVTVPAFQQFPNVNTAVPVPCMVLFT